MSLFTVFGTVAELKTLIAERVPDGLGNSAAERSTALQFGHGSIKLTTPLVRT